MARTTGKRTPTNRSGTAVREKGAERIDEIIRTAKDIFITQGLASLTTRQVAKNLGISVGNLHYYFATKDALLQAIINSVLEGYDEDLRRESLRFPDSPHERLQAFIHYLLTDVRKPDVRGFFYQFWGLSTHNAFAESLRYEMYVHFMESILEILSDVHPDMSKKRLEGLALSMLTFIEGLHVTYGSSEKFLDNFPNFDEMAYLQLMKLAQA
jgi:AcrR family transcriptional regulator